jgi:hypothetical protein
MSSSACLTDAADCVECLLDNARRKYTVATGTNTVWLQGSPYHLITLAATCCRAPIPDTHVPHVNVGPVPDAAVCWNI